MTLRHLLLLSVEPCIGSAPPGKKQRRWSMPGYLAEQMGSEVKAEKIQTDQVLRHFGGFFAVNQPPIAGYTHRAAGLGSSTACCVLQRFDGLRLRVDTTCRVDQFIDNRGHATCDLKD